MVCHINNGNKSIKIDLTDQPLSVKLKATLITSTNDTRLLDKGVEKSPFEM